MTYQTASDVLGDFIKNWHQIDNHTKNTFAYDEALKQLYDLAVAALPEKKPDLRGIKYGEYRGFNEGIDQSIEALARVFNQEKK